MEIAVDADPDIPNPQDTKRYDERMAWKFFGLTALTGFLCIVANNAGSLVAANPDLHPVVLREGISVAAKVVIGTLATVQYLWQVKDRATPLSVKLSRGLGYGSAHAGFWGIAIDTGLLKEGFNPQQATSSMLLLSGLATIGLTQEASHEPIEHIL